MFQYKVKIERKGLVMSEYFACLCCEGKFRKDSLGRFTSIQRFPGSVSPRSLKAFMCSKCDPDGTYVMDPDFDPATVAQQEAENALADFDRIK